MIEVVSADVVFDPFDIEGAVFCCLLDAMWPKWIGREMPDPNTRGHGLSRARHRVRGLRSSLVGLWEAAAYELDPVVKIDGQQYAAKSFCIGTFIDPFAGLMKFALSLATPPETHLLFAHPSLTSDDRGSWRPASVDSEGRMRVLRGDAFPVYEVEGIARLIQLLVPGAEDIKEVSLGD